MQKATLLKRSKDELRAKQSRVGPVLRRPLESLGQAALRVLCEWEDCTTTRRVGRRRFRSSVATGSILCSIGARRSQPRRWK